VACLLRSTSIIDVVFEVIAAFSLVPASMVGIIQVRQLRLERQLPLCLLVAVVHRR
jgi:hypothetical protein